MFSDVVRHTPHCKQSDFIASLQDKTSRAVRVRETIVLVSAWRSLAAGFLQAQQDYRGIQLSYLSLVGSFLSAIIIEFRGGSRVIP